MINHYGYPPAIEDCVEAPAPDWLRITLTQTDVAPGASEAHQFFHEPVSPQAVARQLNQHFNFAENGPIKVRVEPYGWFLIGKEGWCVTK